MLFRRLIWCALGIAVLLGSVQSVLQQLQTVPLILAAEVFEEAPPAPVALVPHLHAGDAGGAPAHSHDAEAWSPAEGLERQGWTWVANVLHAFSMALLALAALTAWAWRRSTPTPPMHTALALAASGWIALHFWPSLGLHAELPGMEAAALGARQGWWLLAVLSSVLACAFVFAGRHVARFAVAIALLALPFVVGAPHHAGDALAAFSGPAHAQMQSLAQQFFWATTWLSISFWGLMGLLGALAFQRWLAPLLPVQETGVHRAGTPVAT